MGTNSSFRITSLIEIFRTETDENHGLTRREIFDRLEARGAHSSRTTFYADLDYLQELGYDIINTGGKSSASDYRLVSRDFEISELKLLVDSVQAAKFISANRSRSLIKKLSALASNNEARLLGRDVIIAGRVKASNEKILYSVDMIHAAISTNVKIRFRYFQWNEKKEMVFRHDGAFYEASPWALIWDDEYYYLVGFDSNDCKIKHFRVDKMADVSVTELPREGREAFSGLDMKNYTNSVFGMFTGDRCQVEFSIANSKAYIFIDRFGKDLMLIPDGPEHVKTVIDVELSPQFVGWVFSLGEGVRVTGPANVVAAIRDEARRQLDTYSSGVTLIPAFI